MTEAKKHDLILEMYTQGVTNERISRELDVPISRIYTVVRKREAQLKTERRREAREIEDKQRTLTERVILEIFDKGEYIIDIPKILTQLETKDELTDVSIADIEKIIKTYRKDDYLERQDSEKREVLVREIMSGHTSGQSIMDISQRLRITEKEVLTILLDETNLDITNKNDKYLQAVIKSILINFDKGQSYDAIITSLGHPYNKLVKDVLIAHRGEGLAQENLLRGEIRKKFESGMFVGDIATELNIAEDKVISQLRKDYKHELVARIKEEKKARRVANNLQDLEEVQELGERVQIDLSERERELMRKEQESFESSWQNLRRDYNYLTGKTE